MSRNKFLSLKKFLYDTKFFVEDFWFLNFGKHKLPKLSIIEKKLIKELREQMCKLKSSVAGKSWEDFVRKLKRYTMHIDPRNFLRWEVIRLTMTMTDTPPECLQEMEKSPDWSSLWLPALKENNFGNPVPHPKLAGSSGTLVVHAWHLFNLKKFTNIDFSSLDVVVEFGGGFGSMCRLMRSLGFKGIYIIYDLPEFSLLQKYYLQSIGLATTSSKDSRPLPGQNIVIDNLEDFKQINKSLASDKKLFIATWSISETPIQDRIEFLKLVDDSNYYLYAFQDSFDNIDNLEFFRKYQAEKNNFEWLKCLSYPRDSRDYYLIGRKN